MSSEWFSNQSDGFLVVRRWSIDQDEDLRNRALITNVKHKVVEETYRGIEGYPWPQIDGATLDVQLMQGLAPLEQLPLVEKYYSSLPNHSTFDLIYCQFRESPEKERILPENYRFCGYDYGYYDAEWSHYSVLYNEVIYGLYASMQAFSRYLNYHLLLPSYNLVLDLEHLRKEMIAANSDLEQYGECHAIAIFAAGGITKVV